MSNRQASDATLPPRAHEHNRWRPTQDLPAVPQVQRDRTKRALGEQCMNARMPGYTGFIPCARAEDLCARSQAGVGRTAYHEQVRRHEMRGSMSQPSLSLANPEGTVAKRTLGFEALQLPDDHPLGKSRSEIVRNHWVPTIPGYSGFIPAVQSESICGGGMSFSCRQAARAIAERQKNGSLSSSMSVRDEADRDRGQMVEQYRELRPDESGITPQRERLAGHLREHCLGKIPGYMGFVPRMNSESIYGATAAGAGRIAADYCEDRVIYPSDAGKRCHVPQVSDKKKLRM